MSGSHQRTRSRRAVRTGSLHEGRDNRKEMVNVGSVRFDEGCGAGKTDP